MVIEGVDYAGSRPDPAALYRAGKRFVVRYGGPGGDWKHLDAAEARALIAAGLSIVANAEGTASGMLGGYSTGADWARSADQHFRGLGMPAGRPIYLSVDFDVTSGQWPAVRDALKGAASAIGPARVGVYGGRRAVEWARRDGVARWFWQTYAWSSGVWVPGNHLEQTRNGVSLAGGTLDLDRALLADYGQWKVEDDMVPEDLLANDSIPNPYPSGAGGEFVTVRTALKAAAVSEVRTGQLLSAVAALRADVAAALGRDPVDEAQIVQGVIATLTPQAIAAAIPDNLAAEVANELARRLVA